MKKVLAIFLWFYPFFVFALNGSIDVDKTNMALEVGESKSFIVSADNAVGKITISTDNSSVCTTDKTVEWLDKDSVTVNVMGVSSGTCVVSIDINGGSYDETPIITVKNVEITVSRQLSSVKTLSELKVDDVMISNFSSSFNSEKYEYSYLLHNLYYIWCRNSLLC